VAGRSDPAFVPKGSIRLDQILHMPFAEVHGIEAQEQAKDALEPSALWVARAQGSDRFGVREQLLPAGKIDQVRK